MHCLPCTPGHGLLYSLVGIIDMTAKLCLCLPCARFV
uniref:Uncharacterized protein n=1 Tax=Arundo donax TaxID=35708 RepID=A0A0A9E2H7_ARUDO